MLKAVHEKGHVRAEHLVPRSPDSWNFNKLTVTKNYLLSSITAFMTLILALRKALNSIHFFISRPSTACSSVPSLVFFVTHQELATEPLRVLFWWCLDPSNRNVQPSLLFWLLCKRKTSVFAVVKSGTMTTARYRPTWDLALDPLVSCKLCLGEFPLEQMTTITQCQCVFCTLVSSNPSNLILLANQPLRVLCCREKQR